MRFEKETKDGTKIMFIGDKEDLLSLKEHCDSYKILRKAIVALKRQVEELFTANNVLTEEKEELTSVRNSLAEDCQLLERETLRLERENYKLKQEMPKLQGEKYSLEKDNANLRETTLAGQNVIDKQANELLSVKELVNTLKLHTQNLEAQTRQADGVIAAQDKEIKEWKLLFMELVDKFDRLAKITILGEKDEA